MKQNKLEKMNMNQVLLEKIRLLSLYCAELDKTPETIIVAVLKDLRNSLTCKDNQVLAW